MSQVQVESMRRKIRCIVAKFSGRWERETETGNGNRSRLKVRNIRGIHLSNDRSISETRSNQFRDDEPGTILGVAYSHNTNKSPWEDPLD